MVWGGIGGVVGFLVSLLGSLVGIVVAGFIGFSCGRRAAVAGKVGPARSPGWSAGPSPRPCTCSGPRSGRSWRRARSGPPGIAATLSDVLGTQVSADEAWIYFLFSLVLSAILEAAVLIAGLIGRRSLGEEGIERGSVSDQP